MSRTFRKTLVLLAMLSFAALSPSFAFAGVLDTVNISMNPKTPGANEDVTISIQSFAVDLTSANIVWYVGGEPKEQGMAKTSFMVHTGDIGQQTVVDIVIIPRSGTTIKKHITIAPAEVDVLWEAKTYTPPFYKGKALPSYKSDVKVIAIPRVNDIASDPSQFSYSWTFNRIQHLGEGQGMSAVTIPFGWSDSDVPVTVVASLPGKGWAGSKSISISGSDPKLLFYEQAPLLGARFEHALHGNFITTEDTLSLRAAPYYFSTDDVTSGSLVNTWMLDGQRTLPGIDPLSLSLAKSGKNAQSTSVALRIQDPKRILQEASGQVTISFPQE